MNSFDEHDLEKVLRRALKPEVDRIVEALGTGKAKRIKLRRMERDRDGDLWKATCCDQMRALRINGKWTLIRHDHINIDIPQALFPDTSPAWTYIGNIFEL